MQGYGADESDIKVSKTLERIAKKYDSQITSVALAYVMHKTPYVFPIVGGRKIEHLKGNIDGLRLSLTEEDINEIETVTPFDIGFPMNFLGGEKGVQNPNSVWLSALAGRQQHVQYQKVI
jgi:diketogulonate reductase-like aldo/keto reductase